MLIKDTVKEKLGNCCSILINKIQEGYRFIIDYSKTSLGMLVIIVSLILGFIFNTSLIELVLSGSIIYLTIILGKFINNKITKNTIDMIDIERFGRTIDSTAILKKKSILDILNDYIEDCFDRDVLFFAPIQRNDYITSELENKLLEQLLDSAISNMSTEIRTIMFTYFGEDNFNIIMGRKCMQIVTIFTAQHNKNIYKTTNDKSTVEL